MADGAIVKDGLYIKLQNKNKHENIREIPKSEVGSKKLWMQILKSRFKTTFLQRLSCPSLKQIIMFKFYMMFSFFLTILSKFRLRQIPNPLVALIPPDIHN